MIETRSSWDGGKITPGKIGRAYLMAQLGNLGVQTIKDRAGESLGSDDQRMKPLNKGYAIKKTKHGKGNKRNLVYSGDMMDALSVRYANENVVKIDITTRHGRIAAAANEARSPWYGWSPHDVEKIIRRAHEIFRESIADIGVVLRGLRAVRGYGSRARWLSSE